MTPDMVTETKWFKSPYVGVVSLRVLNLNFSKRLGIFTQNRARSKEYRYGWEYPKEVAIQRDIDGKLLRKYY